MFVDYYAILEINFDASDVAVKAAYKKQALKWHPDRNPGVDTTQRMQQINEAYLIIKDNEARLRYNTEYQRYKEYQNQASISKKQAQNESQQHERQSETKQDQQNTHSDAFEDRSYQVFDETLNNWMSNARKQAVNLAKQTIEDIIGMSKESGQAIGQAALAGVIRYFVFGIIILIIFKACQ